jgi:hypothetical protein
VDIAPEMLLEAANQLPDDSPDSLMRADVGLGLPFRPGVFHAAQGLDLLHWLFRDYPGWEPHQKGIRTFFQSLHGCLQCGARADRPRPYKKEEKTRGSHRLTTEKSPLMITPSQAVRDHHVEFKSRQYLEFRSVVSARDSRTDTPDQNFAVDRRITIAHLPKSFATSNHIAE